MSYFYQYANSSVIRNAAGCNQKWYADHFARPDHFFHQGGRGVVACPRSPRCGGETTSMPPKRKDATPKEWSDPSAIPVEEIVAEWRSQSKRGRYEAAMWKKAGLEQPGS